MKEDKIAKILRQLLSKTSVELFEDKPDVTYIETDVENAAHQIADLYKPPEEVLLTDGEIQTLKGRCMLPSTDYDRQVAKAQAQKCQAYYEPKGDEEGLAINPHKITVEDVNKSYPKGIPKGYHILQDAGLNEGFDEGRKAQQALDNQKRQNEIREVLNAIFEYFDCDVCDICYEDECGGELSCTKGKHNEPCNCHVDKNRAKQNLERIIAKYGGKDDRTRG